MLLPQDIEFRKVLDMRFRNDIVSDSSYNLTGICEFQSYNFYMTDEERLKQVMEIQPLIDRSEKELETFLKENDPSKQKTWSPSTFRKMNKLVKQHNVVVKQHNKIVLPEFRVALV